MRVLAIRGKNLASLAGEFAVDFRLEPLAQAGVFAISGPTGAGKSTLLDALCLALYHKTPRLIAAQEGNVNIPDVKDHTITPNDPRNLLRRGSGEGWAEAEFVDRTGVQWRARWSVSRARGKADGRLQPAQAELQRCNDGWTFAGTRSELQEQLVALTGLSFEQFCRSVLLAQNEFAALLKAPQRERADLLEALTGTEIFKRISELAHQRNAAEQAQLQALEQRLRLQAPLAPEQRAELESKLGQARAHAEHCQRGLKAIAAECDWLQQGTQLNLRLDSAAANHERLGAQLAGEHEQQLQLQRWSAALPLAPLAQAHADTGASADRLRALQPALAADIRQAAARHALQEAELAAAEQGWALAQDTLQSTRPLIAQVREADAGVQLARHRVQQANEECALGQAQALRLTERIEASRHRRTEQGEALRAWTEWQAREDRLQSAPALWPELGLRLQAALALSSRQAPVEARHLTLAQALTHAELQAEAQARTLTSSQAAALGAANDLQAAEQARQRHDLAALKAQGVALDQRLRAGERLQQALIVAVSAASRHARASESLVGSAQALVDAQEALGQAAAAQAQAVQAAVAARHAHERASLIADAHTERLVDLLVDGEPCPVCGAREHPGVPARNAAVKALLDTLAVEAAQAQSASNNALAAHAHARSDLQAREREHGTLALSVAETASAQSQAQTQLRAAAQALQLDEPDAAALQTAWRELSARLLEEGQLLAAAQSAAAVAESQWELARRAELEARAKLEQARTAHEQAQAALQPQRTQLDAVSGELAALGRELTGALDALQQWPALALTDAMPLADLLRRWQSGQALRERADAAAAALQTLDAEQAALAAAAEQTQLGWARHTQALKESKLALEQAQRQRAELLGEADVDAFAARLEATATTARAAVEHARQALNACLLQLQQQRAALAQQQAQLAETEARRAGFEQRLLDALAGWPAALAPADLAQLQALLATLPADLQDRSEVWAARERTLADLSAQIADLRAQLNVWRVAALSARSPDEAKDALMAAEATRDQALQDLGALHAALGEDDRRRVSARDQLAALDDARAAARRWTILDDYIGAADGSAFKRYAQQFTLEVLIGYANDHLARLARRYRLRRGNEPLSLLIIDGDLGDELRSVHSLSGGETFLVSLALALGLASLSAQRIRVESLFIDEGFGSLDAQTLNIAMEALDKLQSEGRRIGVISHVHDMAERIGVQIRVEPSGPGRSVIRVLS